MVLDKAGRAAGQVARSAGDAALGVARPVGRSAVGFWRGLTYPFKGARFVYLKHPETVRFWIWPIVITIVSLALVFWGAWALHDDLAAWMWTPPSSPPWWLGCLYFAYEALLAVVLVLFALVVGTLVLIVLSNVFSAPFKDLLSEEVERIAIGRTGPPFSFTRMLREVWRTIVIELAKLALYLAVMLPLLLVNLIPAVGSVIYSVVGFLFTAIYFAVDYVDWPASRRDRGLRYRAGMVKRHFWPMFGFGTGVWLFLFIPLVNLLFMPAAVAGGTLLFLDLEGEAAPGPQLEPALPPAAAPEAPSPALPPESPAAAAPDEPPKSSDSQ